ncbi:MAG: ADP-glyceromanno-heptose 6-epimerase [Planctomycetota bacterium]
MPHRLLVTGAAGFIGARFVESLAARGAPPPISVDRGDAFAARPEHAGVDFGDIVDMDELFGWLEAQSTELGGIVHLGACTDTTELDEGFLRRVNLEYSQRLWQVARARGVPFVYASSAATYGDGTEGYADDESKTDRLRPLNPYGESKLRFDQWALAEAAAGREPPAWSGFKFFNVYGFGERHKGAMASVVLKAFDQIRKDGKVRLFRSHHPDYRDGEQKRDFVYVGDVVDVLHFALRKPLRRGIYNLGSGTARTFLDLVRCVFRELGAEERIEFVDTPEAIRARYQYFTQADMGRLREAGYDKPFHSLEEGVHAYVTRLLAPAKTPGAKAQR